MEANKLLESINLKKSQPLEIAKAISKTGLFKSFLGIGKKGLIATLIAGPLLFGGIKSARAENFVPIGNKVSVLERTGRLRKLTDYIAGRTEKTAEDIKNVSDLLYETAIKESGGLRWGRQVAPGGGPGIARSIFMVEPETAQNLISWSRDIPSEKALKNTKSPYLASLAKRKKVSAYLLSTETGLTAKQLSVMSRKQIADLMMTSDRFAAALSRVKYLSVTPGDISTIEARARYWSKYYQGTKNPIKERQYISENKRISEEIKAAQLSKVMSKHIKVERQPTQGLVNRVLHEKKIQHNITSQNKKTASLFKVLTKGK